MKSKLKASFKNILPFSFVVLYNMKFLIDQNFVKLADDQETPSSFIELENERSRTVFTELLELKQYDDGWMVFVLKFHIFPFLIMFNRICMNFQGVARKGPLDSLRRACSTRGQSLEQATCFNTYVTSRLLKS